MTVKTKMMEMDPEVLLAALEYFAEEDHDLPLWRMMLKGIDPDLVALLVKIIERHEKLHPVQPGKDAADQSVAMMANLTWALVNYICFSTNNIVGTCKISSSIGRMVHMGAHLVEHGARNLAVKEGTEPKEGGHEKERAMEEFRKAHPDGKGH